MYSCDVDICDTEGSPVCKPLEEPGPGLLDMEGRYLSFPADNLCKHTVKTRSGLQNCWPILDPKNII